MIRELSFIDVLYLIAATRWTLALTAIAGTTTYGMIMGLLDGPRGMLLDGLRCTAAAGIAWSLPA